MNSKLLIALSPLALLAASCAPTASGESSGPASAEVEDAFNVTALATFKEPWAMAFAPGTNLIFVTEKAGTMKINDLKNGRLATLSGLPKVDYGGQGGLGDVAFLPSEASPTFRDRTIFLTWAESGPGETRGAALGRGTVKCWVADECEVTGLEVIWRQTPKVSGRGHYAHRIAFSPDGKYLFVSSGDRQKMQPAQDPASDLGKIIRIPIDGAGKPTGPAERYSLGHRNALGLKFDAAGRLWDLEHGPAGGDELNLVKPGQNYGWPLVSLGDHYDGRDIPAHSTRPDLAAPAISWNPVIAPGDFLFYSGKLWPEWKGQALIAGMASGGLVRVRIDGETATEVARYPLGNRIRTVVEAQDGSLYVLEDGPEGRLLHLTKK